MTWCSPVTSSLPTPPIRSRACSPHDQWGIEWIRQTHPRWVDLVASLSSRFKPLASFMISSLLRRPAGNAKTRSHHLRSVCSAHLVSSCRNQAVLVQGVSKTHVSSFLRWLVPTRCLRLALSRQLSLNQHQAANRRSVVWECSWDHGSHCWSQSSISLWAWSPLKIRCACRSGSRLRAQN